MINEPPDFWGVTDCPRYVYSDSQIVNFFYEGMSPNRKRMVDASSEGSLLHMTPKEAMEFQEFLADTSKKWEEY